MKKLLVIIAIMAFAITGYCQTGTYTTNEYFYLPSFGEYGTDAFDEYNTYMQIADTQIEANKDATETEAGLESALTDVTNVYTDNDFDIDDYLQDITSESIGDLSDVDTTGVTDDKILKYDLASGKWIIADEDTGDALTTDGLDQFASTTSAELAGVISDETGTGALVFGTSPTLVTPDIDDANGNEILRFGEVADAVNYLEITNSATGNPVKIEAKGSDANLGLYVYTKGTGQLDITNTNGLKIATGSNIRWSGGEYISKNTHYSGVSNFTFSYYDGSSVQTSLYFRRDIQGWGINMTAPTARLHLPAGTATASTAPLKFTTGTLNTTPEAGAMEYSSNELYFTRASTREAVMFNVVEDTTPQLGGDLDATDKNITGIGRASFTQELDNGSKDANFTIDFSTDQKQKVTLTANTMTLTLDTTSVGVANYLLKIVNGGLATLTWASESGNVYWPGGTEPTLTSSGTDIVGIYFDGTDWYCMAGLDFK